MQAQLGPHGISAAAEGFAGFRGTDVYPPADGQRDEWVVVIHFDDEKALQDWLASPVRARWVEKLRAQVGDFELKAVPGGFGPWFAGLARSPTEVPHSWKVALTVLLALYPTVMLLTIFVGKVASDGSFLIQSTSPALVPQLNCPDR